MKILLINPPWIVPKGYEGRLVVPYPLGIGYIASYLEKNKINVKILDILAEGFEIETEMPDRFVRFGLSEKDIIKWIKNFKPDVIGITCMFTTQSKSLHDLAKVIKSNLPKIMIVAGGIHPSSCSIEVMSDENIDFVVKGEGEETILELVKALKINNDISTVKGVFYRNDGKVEYTGDRQLIFNLDDIPFPAYHLLKVERYFKASRTLIKNYSGIYRKGRGAREGTYNRKWVSMITSRGCPFTCFFCSVRNAYGKNMWRPRSPENVLNEIEMLNNKYGITHFLFEDDNMTLDVERVKKIFFGIITRRLNITWEAPNGIRADKLDEELVRLMKSSGCTALTLGVESGDQEFLTKVVKKNLDLKDVIKATRLIRKHEIPLNGFFILGMPGETKETMSRTIRFAAMLARMGMYPEFNIATPLPATEMFDIAVKKNLFVEGSFKPTDIIIAYDKPRIKIEGYTSEQIVKLRINSTILCLLEMLLFDPKAFFIRDKTKKMINPINVIKKMFSIILKRGS